MKKKIKNSSLSFDSGSLWLSIDSLEIIVNAMLALFVNMSEPQHHALQIITFLSVAYISPILELMYYIFRIKRPITPLSVMLTFSAT